jgi:DNA-binding MarR family transcriptional regulator
MEQTPREYEFARLILRLSNQIVRNRNLHVKELGLTTEQADSLQFFLAHENAVITDLKEHLGVTHQTARGIVRRMEEKGLIRTRKSEVDARYQCILPTEKGRQIGERLIKNGVRTGGQLLHGMEPQQQKAFYELLTAALKNVEQS